MKKIIIRVILILIILALLPVLVILQDLSSGSVLVRSYYPEVAEAYDWYVEPKLDQDEVLKLVEKERLSRGLTAYTIDPYLCKWADIRIKEIREFPTHKLFSDTYAPIIYAEGGYAQIGENYVTLYTNEREVVDGWMASEGHRNTILSDLDITCLRCVGSYCVQIFAK